MSYRIELGEQNQEAKFSIEVGFKLAFLKASPYALQDQPVFNAGVLMVLI